MTDTTTHADLATDAGPTARRWSGTPADADDRWPGRWTAHTASVACPRTHLP